MEIKNYTWNDNLCERHNNPLLPQSIRGLIIGKSGCGKTTLLLNLLLNPDWLDYDHLYVFGKSLHQTEYKILRKAFEEKLPKDIIANFFDKQSSVVKAGLSPSACLEQIGKEICSKDKKDIEAHFYDDADEVPDPRDINESHKNLIIFDDLMLEKQNTCEKYYVRGRHNNIDTWYISQNYFKLPRQTIRENANFIILFPQDYKNLNHIHQDHCIDIDKREFKELCRKCWEQPYGFAVIDLSSSSGKFRGKYRCGFDKFYIPDM